MQSESEIKRERKQVFREIVDAFGDRYSWLGAQVSRELLLSAASWNIEQYSDPPMRFRTHIMLAWRRGWVKSSILTKMAALLGEDMCSVLGKVTDAAMRGSVSNGQFTPPKPLKTPIVISTEFGQTTFEDELLNVFLSLLEEGYTNISMNKLGGLPDTQKRNIEKKFNGQISFGQENEFDLQTNFVFWGATYDPRKLQDDALRSRFNVVSPTDPLTGELTEQIDSGKFQVDSDTVQQLRRMLRSEKPSETNFQPPSKLYKKYSLNPRESRDLQSYMAARNWWGLNVNPGVMERYIQHLQESRRRATMSPPDLVLELVFNNPMNYDEIQEETGFDKKQIHKLLDQINAQRTPTSEGTKWAVWSGETKEEDGDNDGLGDFLSGVGS